MTLADRKHRHRFAAKNRANRRTWVAGEFEYYLDSQIEIFEDVARANDARRDHAGEG